MKLLIITQKVDINDDVLGFFHYWIEKLAEKFEKIIVICLQKGEYRLPANVKVLSLGKENLEFGIWNLGFIKKLKYIFNFFKYIWQERKNYDFVFVHMNQEYVVLGGIFWRLLGKKILMWRNHLAGGFFARIAVFFSDVVFCTSRFAFVNKYKKTKIMPVGIDIDKFKVQSSKLKIKNSILFLGRMSPIKKPELLIEALGILNKKNIDFQADFYGDPLPQDRNYYDSLKAKVQKLELNSKINFYGGRPNYETPKIYNEHNIFVNLTPSGSFDKTILEAAACGCLLVMSNKSLSGEIDNRMIVEKETPDDVAKRINFWLNTSDQERRNTSEKLQKYVLENHSLNILISKLCTEK